MPTFGQDVLGLLALPGGELTQHQIEQGVGGRGGIKDLQSAMFVHGDPAPLGQLAQEGARQPDVMGAGPDRSTVWAGEQEQELFSDQHGFTVCRGNGDRHRPQG